MDEHYKLPVSLELRINGGHYNKLMDFEVRAKGKRPSEVEGAKFDHDVLMGDLLSGVMDYFLKTAKGNEDLREYGLDLLDWASRRLEND